MSDPKKKETYDQYGAAAFDGGFDPSSGGGAGPGAGFGGFSGGGFGGAQGGFGGADFNFEDLFSAFGGGRRPGRGGSRQQPFADEILVGENIEVQTNISFMDAAKGATKDIFITPLVECKTCHGNGLKQGTQRTQCKQCNGTGTQVHFMQAGFQMASTCSACGGAGVTIPRGSECGSCSGQGAVRERRTVSVDIPGGVEDGMRLRVKGEGDAPASGMSNSASPRTQKGDLYVFIRVSPDPKFSRNGADILYTASIPVTTAILGGEIRVPTLDGDVKVRVATGTGTGERITLGGMGMKKLGGRRNGFGDLRVEFKVQMPKFLSSNQRALVEMLAADLGDKSAKRIFDMNDLGKDDTGKDKDKTDADSHKNEGFLKSAWHKLTGQHDHLHPDKHGDGAAKPAASDKAEKSDEKKSS